MSATYYVTGLRDRSSAEHQKKVAVLLACKEAGVDLPKELEKYFKVDGRYLKYVSPDDAAAIDLRELEIAKPWNDDSSNGFEVDLDKIPEGVKTIRFSISW